MTGHISGTFGEMVVTMNLFCGTRPATITRENPAGTPSHSAPNDHVNAIAALSAAGLISAGFHSAVEVFQPMSTFTTMATYEGIGPRAFDTMIRHAEALRDYAQKLGRLKANDALPESHIHNNYALSASELNLSVEELNAKALSFENAGTKSQDLISLLQGGGTLATLEVIGVLANYSKNPEAPFELYSLNTQLEDLRLRGYASQLEPVNRLIKEFFPELQTDRDGLLYEEDLSQLSDDQLYKLKNEVMLVAFSNLNQKIKEGQSQNSMNTELEEKRSFSAKLK